MANKKTRALTEDEYSLIIKTIREGFIDKEGHKIKPNQRIAIALTLQANLGLRIGDVINLRLTDIIKDGSRYRLDIVEQKTGKKREFTVPQEVYTYIQSYALERGVKPSGRLFDITVRQVQKHLQKVADYLGLERIGTHSVRKYFSLSIYNNNGYNVELVRQLLQHSTVAVTQHYLSVQSRECEQALQKHIKLPS
ncbi:MAG: tyrosine-type recombinase/integrase [Tepidibacter sp.]|uniref:tyrosine-type recombinase/integrase n=1 Tax=Tepidibacter sp. TaxID=2529387 RepID=UPI0025E25093|nr:tyrosine-type recombinase/integrase [Tepidibacter sp.]MCT4507343.1 tyrosine-type recombinase/integrase [Tepidibacter sp.]